MSLVKRISLPKISDPRGNLTFIEGQRHIPFEIRRVYYLYDVPAESERGGHAHRNLTQLLIAVSGSFDVLLDDGKSRETVTLNKPYEGLLIDCFVWREMKNFSSGSVCMVLASRVYEADDYIRDYQDFMRTVRKE
jgi:hypothetical protein